MKGRVVGEAAAPMDDNRAAGFKKLIVATDFSRQAEFALERAVRLSLSRDASIHLLHVLTGEVPRAMRHNAETEARQALSHMASSASKSIRAASNRRIKITTSVLRGKPYVEIIRKARSDSADLVVLGRHSRRILRDLLLGSTTEDTIRYGSTPVLVVNRKPSQVYRRPLIATDLEDTSYATVNLALRAVGTQDANPSVLYVFQIPTRQLSAYRREFKREAESRMQRLLESVRGDTTRWACCIRCGDPRGEILAEAAFNRTDLLVLGTHGKSGLSHTLLGSVAQKVIREAACDVLVGRPERFSFALP